MNFKNILIGVAIFILTSFVVVYGIQTFYPSPKYEDYCNKPQYYPLNKTECDEQEGIWNRYPEKINIEEENGWCDVVLECSQNYNLKRESYSRNIFIISLIVGILLIVIGVIFFSPEFIGGGIVGGGIFSLLYGTSYYWQTAGNEFKFFISSTGLIIMIIFGYWINNRLNKEKTNKIKK
jgi:hypothetical protein